MVFNFQHTVSSVSFHKTPVLFEGTLRVTCSAPVLFSCLVLTPTLFPSMRTLQLSMIKKLSEGPSEEVAESTLET